MWCLGKHVCSFLSLVCDILASRLAITEIQWSIKEEQKKTNINTKKADVALNVNCKCNNKNVFCYILISTKRIMELQHEKPLNH